MADVNGYAPDLATAVAYCVLTGPLAGNAPVTPTGAALHTSPNGMNAKLTPAITWFYQMECTDAVNTNTATWVVQGTPDWTAVTTQATAAITAAGLNLPVRQIRITSQWPTP